MSYIYRNPGNESNRLFQLVVFIINVLIAILEAVKNLLLYIGENGFITDSILHIML